jgi:glycosyltransferase involved in cell wall biosynthesis
LIYYFLPGAGIYGGVKVACQFSELLCSVGVATTTVLPGGDAPQWFRSQAPVISESEAIDRLTADDVKMITWPPDYQRLKNLTGSMVCHCQGTDPLMDEIFADGEVPILSCWQQARDYVHEHFDRTTIDVGMSISDCFFFDGCVKDDLLVAYMPRRGFPWVRRCFREIPAAAGLEFVAIDGLGEAEVAKILKRAGIFLATAVGEQFGLPALEAMAAGCLVLSVPVRGGMEYLDSGANCLVVEPERLARELGEITRPEKAGLRAVLRSRAVATAMAYRRPPQRRRLAELVKSEVWQQAVG